MIDTNALELGDAELTELALMLTPGQLVELLEKADDEARAARRRVDILTRVAFDRTDVTRQQMADALGVDRRTVYKRRDRA